MIAVVAVASTASPNVAVIDFSASPPTWMSLQPPVTGQNYAAGYVVDCYGWLLVVGDFYSGYVYLYSILDPATPTLCGSVDTGLSSVTAISTDGTYVLAGGGDGRLALVNVANVWAPGTPFVTATALGSISSVVIRYPNALACAYQDGVSIDCSQTSVTPSGMDGLMPANYNWGGQWTGDLDGTMAAITSAGDSPQGIAVFSISKGAPTYEGKWDTGGAIGYGANAIAIAEIPQGGYYLATGLVGGGVFIRSNVAQAVSLPVQQSILDSAKNVAVKFLNNPAIAPFLAVAYVTDNNEYYLYLPYLLLEGAGGSNGTIQIAQPVPNTVVTLGSMENPTLGITAFEPPPWQWMLPWLARMWQTLQRLQANFDREHG